MTPFDFVALIIWIACWIFYEPLLTMLTSKRGALNDHMLVVRSAWMRQIAYREVRIADGQFIGHTLNSATFFGSANLIVMAAIVGVLFDGEMTYENVAGLGFFQAGTHWLFELKLIVVMIALSRGLLEFVWSIRQINYCLAAIGSMPDRQPPERRDAWASAIATILNPAMRTFSRGVRSYYFALSAAAWFFGASALLAATFGAVGLLAWRQTSSATAEGVRRVRALADEVLNQKN